MRWPIQLLLQTRRKCDVLRVCSAGPMNGSPSFMVALRALRDNLCLSKFSRFVRRCRISTVRVCLLLSYRLKSSSWERCFASSMGIWSAQPAAATGPHSANDGGDVDRRDADIRCCRVHSRVGTIFGRQWRQRCSIGLLGNFGREYRKLIDCRSDTVPTGSKFGRNVEAVWHTAHFTRIIFGYTS